MILVYSENITPRLKYIFNLFFNTLLNNEIKFTTGKEEFVSSDLPKINYSYLPFGDELFLKAHKLLFEKDIKEQDVKTFDWNKDTEIHKVFFPAGDGSFMPFDPFAAGFYLITRYEEYLPFEADEYGRYKATESLACKNDLLDRPVINIWSKILENSINQHYTDLINPANNYQYIPTIDIDNAYSFLHKGMVRSVGGGIRSLINLMIRDTSERAKVLLKSKTDPFDTYDYIKKTDKIHDQSSIYFFLVGKYSKHDKSIPSNNKHFQSLIRSISENNKTGIHPSYLSNSDIKILQQEIDTLFTIVNNKIIRSRQHFIKLSFPETYRNLINSGIKEDYSMGYPAFTGFRAGICTPHKYFDLSAGEETGLAIYPFQVMDMTLKEYMGLSPEGAIEEIGSIINKIKKVKGTFISLWHNESLSETGGWEGWRKVYEEMHKLAQ